MLFYLLVDAYNIAIGACLMQLGDNKIYYPISFLRKNLLLTQRNYSTFSRKVLTLITAVPCFKPHSNDNFTIFSDHQPLSFIQDICQKPKNRLLRWPLELASYRITIKHLRGRDNCISDFSVKTNRNVD